MPTRRAVTLPLVVPIVPVIRDQPFDDPAYLFEPKYDGFRGLLYLSGRECHFRSKRGNVLKQFDQLCYWVRSSVMAVRCGDAIEELIVWEKLRTTDSAKRVVVEMERLGLSRGFGITVDEPGLGGGVIDALEALGVTVRPYNGGRTASRRGQERFANIRAESYSNLQTRLERGTIALPPDDMLADELCAIRWRPATDGRLELESKEELRARLGRSPDRADALAMAFAGDGYARLIA